MILASLLESHVSSFYSQFKRFSAETRITISVIYFSSVQVLLLGRVHVFCVFNFNLDVECDAETLQNFNNLLVSHHT